MAFHEIRFPTQISLGAHGGPERRTDIVVLGSGFEERNSLWASSRRRYNAGYGVKALDDLHTVISFFEERRGRLYGFRWRDPMDFKSTAPGQSLTPLDQNIGTGDGVTITYQMIKRYGNALVPWDRVVSKPVSGTVRVAVDGVEQLDGTDFTVDSTSGVVTFLAGHVPGPATAVTAGFEFDVPVRFDTDKLEVNLQGFAHGSIPNIPIVEIRI